MKRNLIPLLGIAFVVALAATGIFYGVFVTQLKHASSAAERRQIVVAARTLDRGTVLKQTDLKRASWAGAPPPGAFPSAAEAVGKTLYTPVLENEPVTESRLSAKGATGLGIERGMRALSVRVVDSTGLLPFLHAGQHVDVQAIQGRNNPDTTLRTILQNVEVLGVQPPPEGSQGTSAAATVTLLASPENADRIAVADSGANIRLLLRNPLDGEEGIRAPMPLAAVFKDRPAPVPAKRITLDAAAAQPEDRVEFLVRMGEASLAGPPHAMQITVLPKDEPQNRFAQVLASSRLTGSNLHPASLRAGSPYGLRILFYPRSVRGRSLRLRVQPEVILPSGETGVSTRRMVTDLDVAEGQSLMISGLGEPDAAPTLAARLFGDQATRLQGSDFLVVVTPRLVGQGRSVGGKPGI